MKNIWGEEIDGASIFLYFKKYFTRLFPIILGMIIFNYYIDIFSIRSAILIIGILFGLKAFLDGYFLMRYGDVFGGPFAGKPNKVMGWISCIFSIIILIVSCILFLTLDY